MIEKQILDYTDADVQELVAKIVKNGSAVLHDQNLTRQELAQACAKLGKVEELDYFMNPEDSPQISIVSGKIIDGKAIGIFGPTELEWHANGTGRYNFKEICVENKWDPSTILCLDKRLSLRLDVKFFDQSSENLKSFKAAVIFCEYLISDSGKILLSEHQIRHFKIPDLPETMVVFAKRNQLVKDVSQGMTFLKNKYKKQIPTNIRTLNIKSNVIKEKFSSVPETSAKNIYLLLEEDS